MSALRIFAVIIIFYFLFSPMVVTVRWLFRWLHRSEATFDNKHRLLWIHNEQPCLRKMPAFQARESSRFSRLDSACLLSYGQAVFKKVSLATGHALYDRGCYTRTQVTLLSIKSLFQTKMDVLAKCQERERESSCIMLLVATRKIKVYWKLTCFI